MAERTCSSLRSRVCVFAGTSICGYAAKPLKMAAEVGNPPNKRVCGPRPLPTGGNNGRDEGRKAGLAAACVQLFALCSAVSSVKLCFVAKPPFKHGVLIRPSRAILWKSCCGFGETLRIETGNRLLNSSALFFAFDGFSKRQLNVFGRRSPTNNPALFRPREDRCRGAFRLDWKQIWEIQ